LYSNEVRVSQMRSLLFFFTLLELIYVNYICGSRLSIHPGRFSRTADISLSYCAVLKMDVSCLLLCIYFTRKWFKEKFIL
jgi:hypothetical protein